MQKLCFGLFGLIITTGAFAADLCIKNDAMVVAMNPLVSGAGGTADGETSTAWSVRFPYGTVSGIATWGNDCATAGCVATNQNMALYNGVYSAGGRYCYCKMLRPALSLWVFSGYVAGGSRCQLRCAEYVQTSAALRSGLFRSINAAD